MNAHGAATARLGTGPAVVEVALLDDDHDFRRSVEDFLTQEGTYKVRSFSHPEDLLLSVEEAVPDIVLLELKLGEFQGGKLIEQLHARHPGLCIIVVSASPSLESMREAFRLKIYDYLAKPSSLAQLRQVLQSAVDTYGLGRAAHQRLRQRLGHCLKMMRVERDWSLKDLSSTTKLSVSQISSIERGAHLPSFESFLALCRAFNRRPSEVLASIDF